MMDLYKESLMDHYRNPRNHGKLENPDFSTTGDNPSCGDSILMEGIIKDGILTDVKFSGYGCVLSQASSSMLSEQAKGKKIEEILKMDKNYMMKLVGSQLGPNRLQCAMLSLEALQKGIKIYKAKKEK